MNIDFLIAKLIKRIVVRFEKQKFMSRAVVFGVDLMFSTFSTIVGCVLVCSLAYRKIILEPVLALVVVSLILSASLFYLFQLYQIIIRHATFRELFKFLKVSLLKALLMFSIMTLLGMFSFKINFAIVTIDMAITSMLMVMSRGMLVSIYYSFINRSKKSNDRVLVCGTDLSSVSLLMWLISHETNYTPIGFLSYGNKQQDFEIRGFPLFTVDNKEDLQSIVRHHEIRALLFSDKLLQKEKERLVSFGLTLGMDILVNQELEKTNGTLSKSPIREVKIEDLLDREPIPVDLPLIESFLRDKIVFVSGAAGSIGSELVRQLANMPIKSLILLDNAETPLHNLRLEISSKFPDLDVEFVIGNVTSSKRIHALFSRVKPNVVFHAAAYKHVPLMEENPCEAVLANVLGTKNVAEMSVLHGVQRFVMVSTDKAVNPTNVMGASKRLAEMFVQSMNGEVSTTRFITTRFGNVLGSNGSVIPLFRQQIAEGGPVTVTHPDIIRYFMTIPEACNLVLQAASMGQGGEVFVFDMGEQVRIADMAKRMIALAGLRLGRDIEIQYTGLRPGEKLYEELLSNQEETTETQHGKIRKAQVPVSDFKTTEDQINVLIALAQHIEVEETVKMMKEIVPEFLSQNSKFEIYDKKKNEKV